MDDERLALRLGHFRSAIEALNLALAQPEDEFLRDSIIKRFELCFETARKALRQWLSAQQELADTATKKEVMEAAFQTGLVDDPDLWNEMAAYRNDASHEYDKRKAIALVAFVRQRAAAAFEALSRALATR